IHNDAGVRSPCSVEMEERCFSGFSLAVHSPFKGLDRHSDLRQGIQCLNELVLGTVHIVTTS
ncbi:MAG TPA: hypothetical protein VJB16_04150, partial [archaeon]|nr:hypothetical protein [archaeon]